MSQQEDPIAVRLAKMYLAGFDEDPLLDHPDIKQYAEPNFIGTNGKFYLCRCFNCPDADELRGTDNYYPARATGRCAWCGWKPDPEIIAYIYSKMVLAGETDMHELRELKAMYWPAGPWPDKRGMTEDEIKENYPTQYAYGKRGVRYDPSDTEDDGYPD